MAFLAIPLFVFGKTNNIKAPLYHNYENNENSDNQFELRKSKNVFADYFFEVTTSCGVVEVFFQSCECDYWQLLALANSVGLSVNQRLCPDDTPGSQHVRVIMP